ncbi:hypothetical protein [Sinorhizobium medicae]|uniref:hypothetical protein n=1 Tax=Sinorhizobium medicae TaxID=110321 RepID=UPI0003F92647|nr:hypothetical protein [Sinorhizobium medicae]
MLVCPAAALAKESAFKKLQIRLLKGIAVILTPAGFTLAPMNNGKIIKPTPSRN